MTASARQVSTIETDNPASVTLAAMGRCARAAADTWTMRQWAARLATKAGPKDFKGQLAALYAGIVERWRYVMEDGEWIHGTPRSLLATVLGLGYNGVADPTRADVERTPIRERGWGDCDDVSTLVAAGVIALGMRPVWRVSRVNGAAHVSVAAYTPSGQVFQLDPVGHPDHGFDWAQRGPGVDVQYFSLEGLPLDSIGDQRMQGYGNYTVPRPVQAAGQFYPGSMITSSTQWQAVPLGFGSIAEAQGTYLGVLARAPRGGLTPYQSRVRRHLCVVNPNDNRGARVLAVPGYHARTMLRNVVVDGTPAVDQFGGEYAYCRGRDLWVPRASRAAARATYGFGETRQERKARRKAKRRRTMKRIGRAFVKVGQFIRKGIGKLLGSKFVQTIIAGALQVFGMPMRITKQILSVAGKFVGGGGLIKLLKGIRKNPKKVLKTLAKTVAAAGRSDLLKGVKGLSGPGGGFEPVIYQLEQGGVPFYAAPVEGIVGLDGVFGDAGDSTDYSEKPTPGYFYRVRKGDNPSDIAEAAYGKALPGAKWISQSPTNAYATRPTKTAFEKKYYGDRIISLLPKYSGELPGGAGNKLPALWIPPAAGVEPSVSPIIPSGPPIPADDDPAFDDDETDEGSIPGPTPVPPAPPVTPDEDYLPDVDDEEEPLPQPPTPVKPVEPSDTIPNDPTDPTPAPSDNTNPLKPIPWDDAQPQPDPAKKDDNLAVPLLTLLASALLFG